MLVNWIWLSLCLCWYTRFDWACVYAGTLELIEPVFMLVYSHWLSLCLCWYAGFDWACVYAGTLELIEPVFKLVHCHWLSLCLCWYTGIDWSCVLYSYIGITIHRSSSLKVDSAIPTRDILLLLVTTAKSLTVLCSGDRKLKKAKAERSNVKDAVRQLIVHVPSTILFRILECSQASFDFLI